MIKVFVPFGRYQYTFCSMLIGINLTEDWKGHGICSAQKYYPIDIISRKSHDSVKSVPVRRIVFPIVAWTCCDLPTRFTRRDSD
jgi:hypothetical protein